MITTGAWVWWAGLVAAAPSLSSLARDTERVESVREIKDITKTFGHLAQYGKFSDMAALFSDNGTLLVQVGMPSANTSTITGPAAIASWLKADAGDMNGAKAGSLNVFIVESPVVSLSAEGTSAKARWNILQLAGNGNGDARIQGGILENEYEMGGNRHWKISLMHYYMMYAGPYVGGWHNVGTGSRTLPIIPFHFTADSAGIPIPLPDGSAAPSTTATVEELSQRITRLNDEDEVRNLQHSYGYYVDRRMWPDATDLFAPNATVTVNGARIAGGVRQFLATMGPEGLTQGILNDRPMFETIVDVNGTEAVSRGLEIGMLGDANTHAGTWEFNLFRNRFVKDDSDGLWRIKALDITQLMVANYTQGWGNGGTYSATKAGIAAPAFIEIARQPRAKPATAASQSEPASNATDLADLLRRVSRSAAFDSSENDAASYGYYADDIRCDPLGEIHAKKGHKENSGYGYFRGAQAVADACNARYGSSGNRNPQRGSVPFHWKPQPVIFVSFDGKSAGVRTRLLQFGTSNSQGTGGGFSGVAGFNGGMYHDQTVLEQESGKWKLWSTTIDEFYWNSPSWAGGWAAATKRAERPSTAGTNGSAPPAKSRDLPADLSLKDPRLGEREVGLEGGSGKTIAWPEIRRMWFAYRNPVTGKVPDSYWPGCVPCKAEPTWALLSNGYQEPPTGPTLVTASATGSTVTVKLSAGPDEPVSGTVEVRDESGNLLGSAAAAAAGSSTTVKLSTDLGAGKMVRVFYLGSDRLRPGKATILVT